MHMKFPQFTVPPNLSDLKLWLPTRAVGLLEGYTAEGGATTGFGDTALEKKKLRRTILRDATPIDVLVHAANESPTFYTVLVFPRVDLTRNQAEKEVPWFWGSLNAPAKPLYRLPLTLHPPRQPTKAD